MSTEPASLLAALGLTGLALPQLFMWYVALGGTATVSEVAAHVEGRDDHPFADAQHDTLVHALNERFMELGLDHPLPYRRA